MKLTKVIRDKDNAKKICEFMSGLYIKQDGGGPVSMYVLSENSVGVDIIVFGDKVKSKIGEDLSADYTEPWNLYTFLDLMRNAGYYMDNADKHSNVRIFKRKESYECCACLEDCKHTGTAVWIPVYSVDGPDFVPVRMCITCAAKYSDEYNRFIDLKNNQPKPEDKECEKKGFFRKLFSKLFGK